MHIIVLCGFKGGTARTSTCLHLGSALALQHNKRVLLIDFDPQANLSTGLGRGTDSLDTLVPVLQGEKSLIEVIQPTEIAGLDLIAANTYLDQIEATAPLVTDPYAHERLRKALKTVDYDFIFIDIPPSLGWLCQSAFFAAHYSLICAVPEAYSVLALHRLAKYHDAIKQNHAITVLGVVLSMWDERHATNEIFLQGVEAVFPGKTLHSKVRRDIAVSRAVLQGQPVFTTAPHSRAAEDYTLLTQELFNRIEVRSNKKEICSDE